MNIPIVIAAYNRDHALSRLLSSLSNAYFTEPVTLIISIDGGGPESVINVARNFDWKFGEKELVEHPENLGLHRHILSCGSLAEQYDGIILLEDDLYVSPWFYDYTIAALEFYKDCISICGISLYSYRYNETSLLPFIPLHDGSHTFFMQVPCSWGQAWLKGHWSAFKNWYKDHCDFNYRNDPSLPPDAANWPATSWKKYFFKYMVEQNKYFVYPVSSYTTNFSDQGQHQKGSNLYQVPIQLVNTSKYVFLDFEESFIKYDAWHELIPECLNRLSGYAFDYEFSVDLHGTKRIESFAGEYVVTSKKCKSHISTFGRCMVPVEMNIINRISGNDIYLARIEQIEDYGDIDDYILKRARNMENQMYYCPADTINYSLLQRAKYKVYNLYQQGQLIEGGYREVIRHLHCYYNSLFLKLSSLKGKMLDSLGSRNEK
jgi:hypothetical protein